MAGTYISQHNMDPIRVAVHGLAPDDVAADEYRQSADLVSLRIGPHLSIIAPLADLRAAVAAMRGALAAVSAGRAAAEDAAVTA